MDPSTGDPKLFPQQETKRRGRSTEERVGGKHAPQRHWRPFPCALEGLVPVSALLQSAQHTAAQAIVTNAFAVWHREAVGAAWSPQSSAESTCSFSP